MPQTADYLAVYDLSSDKERDRVAGVLEGFGFRVQPNPCRRNQMFMQIGW